MKKLIFFFAAFAAFVSCTKEPVGGDFGQDEAQVITFKAVAAKSSKSSADADTKTVLVDHSLVHWSNADQVKVGFFPVTGSSKNNIKNKNGIFTATFAEEAASTAWFSMDDWKWDAGNSENASHYRTDGLAVYPATATVSSSRSGNYNPATTEVSYNLPSEQMAVLNSFQSGVNFSYAKVNKDQFSANKATLSFMNGCSLLKLTLPASAENVAMIEVTSNNNVALTGKFGVTDFGGYYKDQPWYNANDDGTLNFSAVSGNTSSSVILKADEDKTLQAGGTYYIVVWPGTHSSGLSFEFTNTDGATCVKSVGQNVTFERAVVERFNFTSEINFVKEPHLEVNKTSLSLNATSGSATFTVLANYDWNVSDNASWLSVSPASGEASLSATTVTVTAENNTDYTSSRSAVITVTAGGLTKTINVTQAAAVKPQYAYLSTLYYAANLSDGQMYVIRRCQNKSNPSNNYYLWSNDSNNNLKVVYNSNVNNTSGNAINIDEVFIFEKYSSSATLSDGNYKSHCAGYLKSVATGKYLKSNMTFTASSKNEAQILGFANRYGSDTTADVDIYLNGTTTTLYSKSDGSMGTDFINNPAQDTRKWIFQTVYKIN